MSKDVSLSTELPLSTKNLILKSLPAEDFNQLLPDLEPVNLASGEVLYRPEEPIKYVYFPNNAMVSVVATTVEGQCAEVGVVGFEGMVGLDVLLGADSSLNETFVQLPDGGLRMTTAAVRKHFTQSGALHDSLLRFIRLLMMQISQTALCNRLHTVEERLARWLLLCRDRSPTADLRLTQEFLGIMLGTNRATITVAALALQSGGFIRYTHGLITVLDRDGLEHFSCDCYRTVKKEYDRFLQ